MNARDFLAVAAIAVFAGGAAAEESAPGTVAIDFVAADRGADWFVEALEQLVARELLRFHRVRIAGGVDTKACPGRDVECLLDAYRTAGVDVVVFGEYTRGALEYAVHETRARVGAFDGTLDVARVKSATLVRHVGDIVRPIVSRGGLLDQTQFAANIAEEEATPNANTNTIANAIANAIANPNAPPRGAHGEPGRASGAGNTARRAAGAAHSSAPVAPAPRTPARGFIPYFLAALIFLTALPLAIARMLTQKGAPLIRGASSKWCALIVTALALVLVAVAVPPAGTIALDALSVLTPITDVLAPIVAGMLWGAFVVSLARWVFAPIHGLGRIRHHALWPLLVSWIELAALRAILLLAGLPLLLVALLVFRHAAISERTIYAFIIPSVGLLAWFQLLALVDHLAVFLDRELVLEPATERNPWHTTIKRYFLGYVRRMGVELDPKLVERTLFLPTHLATVGSYGGGFARPRILVGEAVREAALGELPEETEAPERTVNPDELPFGFITPSPVGDLLVASSAEEARRARALASPRPRAALPRLIGESATLLGWVVPRPIEESLPLIANTQEDFDVVKKLLTMHYAGFEKNIGDDEIDDTDPTQKDFLFGALIREMGTLVRGDSIISTIAESLRLGLPKTSRVSAGLIRAYLAIYERFLSVPATAVGDAYAALNQGLHHLVQYLYFLRGGTQRLTTRADLPGLLRASREILAHSDGEAPKDDDRHLFRATPRNRLLWLSQFFNLELDVQRDRRVRIAVVTTIALAFAAIAGATAKNAIDYHPRYVARMNELAARAAEAKQQQGAGDDRNNSR